MVGTALARYRQAAVSLERMDVLLQGDSGQRVPAEALVRHGPLYERGAPPPVPYVRKSGADRLETLEARGLTYTYPESGRGVAGIDLCLARGSFTVVTGRIGAGKTTLLRVLLGLLPAESGTVLWNGSPVADASAFFVPPRCAYTPQVPRLFSETLRSNILAGLPEDRVDLAGALRLAVMESDLAGMEHGLDTLVGPKGVRLSGGQLQRAAAARMFVRDPELLVLDDLSSALDVETERTLWQRLLEGRDSVSPWGGTGVGAAARDTKAAGSPHRRPPPASGPPGPPALPEGEGIWVPKPPGLLHAPGNAGHGRGVGRDEERRGDLAGGRGSAAPAASVDLGERPSFRGRNRRRR
jgi:ATP-binding cassette subfamily B protein